MRAVVVRTIGAVATLLLAAALLSCTEDRGISVLMSPQETIGLLPAPSTFEHPPRNSSTLPGEHFKSGAGYEPSFPNQRVAFDGMNGVFTPAFVEGNENMEGLAFAIYDVHMESYPGELRARLIWDGPAPEDGNCWIGLGNLIHDRWDWLPVDGESATVFGSLSAFTDDANYMLCAVVVGGGSIHELKRIRFGEPMVAYSYGAAPRNGSVPHTVDVDLADFEVPGATVESYDVDWDNDGIAEGTNLTIETGHTFNETGLHTVGFVLHTDEGDLVFEQQLQTLLYQWDYRNLEEPGALTADFEPWIAVIDGLPMIASIRSEQVSDETYLSYLRLHVATDVQAGGWNEAIELPYEDLVSVLGMVDFAGLPCILFQTFDGADIQHRLKVTRAQDPSLQNWSADPPVLLEQSNALARTDAALAMIAGSPAVAYMNSDQDIYYTRRTSSWPAANLVISPELGASSVTLGVIDGRPAIAVSEGTISATAAVLRIADNLEGTDGSWRFADAYEPGANPSVTVGLLGPVYTVWDGGFQAIIIRSTEDHEGFMEWSHDSTSVAGTSVGYHTFLGPPCLGSIFSLCAYDPFEKDLWFGNPSLYQGQNYTANLQEVESSGAVGRSATFCVSGSLPILAYEDEDSFRIRIARLR